MNELTKYQRYYRKNRVKRMLETREYTIRLRLSALETLGGKCVSCGFSDKRALQIDHVNGGGKYDIARTGKGGPFCSQVIKSFLKKENKYQLLCANCNWIKRSEKAETKKRTLD